MNEDLKLFSMDSVTAAQVEWLWQPYIPLGKITIVQGDGGDGKTTMILAIAAAVSCGLPLPENATPKAPASVIYQTAEDGLADTIKPRLTALGADCARVLVIDESDKGLTLSDARIEQAIMQTGARLFILDPLQAYLGADVDMHRANEVRPVFKQLGGVAERTGCAVVIIGHLNKGGSKNQYRGLGSVDIFAAARSVLTLGRVKGQPHLRAFAHGKSNLAPEGEAIAFELDPDAGFRWIGKHAVTLDELLGGFAADSDNTFDRAAEFLKAELAEGEQPAAALFEKAAASDIGERTLRKAKSALGVRSFKRQDKWHWALK